jgi:membrane protein
MTLPSWIQSFLDRVSAAELTDRAAALTYYGFLSLFPALIVVVALIGLIGDYPDTYQSIVNTLRDAAPGPAVDLVDSALEDAVDSRGGAGSLLGIGLVVSLYSASGATGGAVRAVEAVYDDGLDYPWWHSYVVRFLLTIVLGMLFLLAFAGILLAGPLFGWVAETFGVSESVSSAISVVRWPVGLMALLIANLLIYWSGSGRRRRARQLLPGAIASMLVTLVATAGFNFYVSNFDTYGATYGSLGAVIVLLVWMWISSLALLCGAVINAELEAAGKLSSQ